MRCRDDYDERLDWRRAASTRARRAFFHLAIQVTRAPIERERGKVKKYSLLSVCGIRGSRTRLSLAFDRAARVDRFESE